LAVDGVADWLRPFTAPRANVPPEVATRIGSVVLIIWLIVGAIAAGQRHYYKRI
jgi:beta-lactamase regulating signal transducer with metallopeptidase domain